MIEVTLFDCTMVLSDPGNPKIKNLTEFTLLPWKVTMIVLWNHDPMNDCESHKCFWCNLQTYKPSTTIDRSHNFTEAFRIMLKELSSIFQPWVQPIIVGWSYNHRKVSYVSPRNLQFQILKRYIIIFSLFQYQKHVVFGIPKVIIGVNISLRTYYSE